ncbi:hypothetical protein FRC11_007214, partial [Ceratobasidium sp. 423]
LMLLALSTCSDHIKTHLPLQKKMPKKRIISICQQYNVYDGLLTDLDPPTGDAPAPLPFLPVDKAWMCSLCDGASPYLGVSDEARRQHFFNKHYTQRQHRNEFEVEVDVQTFCTSYTSTGLFRVFPQVQAARDRVEGGVLPPDSEQLIASYLQNWSPAQPPGIGEDNLQNVAPFWHNNGWLAHISGHDPAFLWSLVQPPATGNTNPLSDSGSTSSSVLVQALSVRHPYAKLVEAAQAVFQQDQEEFAKKPGPHLIAIMDEGQGGVTHKDDQFKRLETADSVKEYGRTWGLWAVFLCRLLDLQESGNSTYTVTFNKRQLPAVRDARAYAHGKSFDPRRVFTALANAFWRPESTKNFEIMVESQFNDPTVRFAVLLNLFSNGTFQTPRNASHNLVHIKYFIRAGLYMWARDDYKRHPRDYAGLDIPDMIAPSLTRRRLSPFACVCIMTSSARGYAETTTSLPNVIWTGSRTLRLEGRELNFDRFRLALATEIIDLERYIMDDVLLGKTLAELDFHVDETTKLVDDQTITAPGYSMFKERPFIKMTQNLAGAFLSDQKIASELTFGVGENKKILYKPVGCTEWLTKLGNATRRLMRLMFLCGGQTCRGTEMCILKRANTLYRLRNVFAYRAGLLVYVVYYNKTTAITGLDRIVAHPIPWLVGRLYLILGALAVPFAGSLTEYLYTPERRTTMEYSVFSYHGNELTSDDLSAEIFRFFNTTLEVPVRIRLLRHFFIACQRHFMPEAFSPMKRILYVADGVGGHTTNVAERHYALDVAETQFLHSGSIKKYVDATMHWWRILFAPSSINNPTLAIDNIPNLPEILTKAESSPETEVESSRPEPNAPLTDFRPIIQEALQSDEVKRAMQQFILSAVSSGSQAGGTPPLPTLTTPPPPITRNQESSPAGPSNSKLPITSVANENPSPANPSSITPAELVEPKHLNLLRLFLNDPNAQFKNHVQAQALVHVLNRQTSVLCINGTGSGKSFVFAIAPLAETGITVVIFPLQPLMDDQVEKSQSRDPASRFHRWHRGLSIDSGLVAVSIEEASKEDFMFWALDQHRKQRLSRFVFDECHMIYTEAKYRNVMDKFANIVSVEVPLVLLTATLPPALEKPLCGKVGNPNWVVLRGETQRPSLKYRTGCFASRDAALAALVRHIVALEAQLKEGEGIMIQCCSYADVRDVAEVLPRTTHSRELDDDTRKGNASKWITGEIVTIIATSGLSTGVHHPKCRVVAYFGCPWGMIDFAQGSGRAGRDGLAAFALIFAWTKWPQVPEKDKDFKCLAEMVDMLKHPYRCIRWEMSRCLDGVSLARSCSELGFKPCGACAEMLSPGYFSRPTSLSRTTMKQNADIIGDSISDDSWLDESIRALGGESTSAGPPAKDKQHAVTPYQPPSRHPMMPASPARAGPSRRYDIPANRESAAAFAPPFAPGGAQLTWDAQLNVGRASAAQSRAANSEDAYAPYTFATLLRIKDLAQQELWCALCITTGLPHTGHRLTDPCTKGNLQDARRAWALNMYTIGGIKIGGMKTSLGSERLLEDGTCFMCFWPTQERHKHPKPGPETNNARFRCTVKDFVLHVCWLAFYDPLVRAALLKKFGLDAECTLMDYGRWLYRTSRKLQWNSEPALILNAHKVLIWVVVEHRNLQLINS